MSQLIGSLMGIVFAVIGGLVIYSILKKALGLRLSEDALSMITFLSMDCYHCNRFFTETDGVPLGQILWSETSINASSMHSNNVRRGATEVPRPNIAPYSQSYYYGQRGRSFAEALEAMPNVGLDDDFARVEDEVGNDYVFS